MARISGHDSPSLICCKRRCVLLLLLLHVNYADLTVFRPALRHTHGRRSARPDVSASGAAHYSRPCTQIVLTVLLMT